MKEKKESIRNEIPTDLSEIPAVVIEVTLDLDKTHLRKDFPGGHCQILKSKDEEDQVRTQTPQFCSFL